MPAKKKFKQLIKWKELLTQLAEIMNRWTKKLAKSMDKWLEQLVLT